jgi:hypothetical protein
VVAVSSSGWSAKSSIYLVFEQNFITFPQVVTLRTRL